MAKQRKLQSAVNEQLQGFTSKTEDGVYKMQGAAVCIQNSTGRVVAIVGGRKQKAEGFTLNRAFQSFRQPGSSIKPLVVYTPAFEYGYTPESIVLDEQFEGGPRNSNGKYSGKIPIRSAVAASKNVVAWKLFEELTPQRGLSYILNMGFSKIVANDYYPASSLGGLTNGASPLEMAAGFATIENEGEYRRPTCGVKITGSRGTEIYKKALL
jgi:membrane peptidoglycan carboxypeptidase